MTRDIVTTDKIAKPVGPFSAAVRANGFLFFSGLVAQDPATAKLVTGGIAAQAQQIFRNLEALLQASGKTFDNVVKTTVYLTDMANFAPMNDIYGRHFAAPFPARTTVAVRALPLGALVEIEAIVG
jgi:2-iminobutanoate/2-iminopropanoate deaminase